MFASRYRRRAGINISYHNLLQKSLDIKIISNLFFLSEHPRKHYEREVGIPKK
jgi:hypothetical protein